MIANIRQILDLLTPREKRRGALVLAMVMVMAVLETAGVASVMPFLAVLGDPAIIERNSALKTVYGYLDLDSVDGFLWVLGVYAFIMVVIAAIFRIATKHVMNRFTQMRRHSIGTRLLETYLRQPYSYFLNRHSADMSKSILSEVDQLVRQVFQPGMQLIAYLAVVIALVVFLVALDPVVALVVGAFIGGCYVLIYWSVRGLLARIGRDRVEANRERFTAAGEALNGIKDIKLLGREHTCLSRFTVPSVRFARHQATKATLSEVPKYLIEAIGVGGVLGLALLLLGREGGLEGMLPVLGVYVFAGYRLLPAAQHVYAGFASLRFGLAAVEEVHRDIQTRQVAAKLTRGRPQLWRPKHSIVMKNITFQYAGATAPALRDITLTIPVSTSFGIVGSTGAGKTTLVDILLGLLEPTAGTIAVDGRALDQSNLQSWQAALGYVPQDIFLADATVEENIGFGIPSDEIDRAAVIRAARQAQIHDFIEALPHGYGTMVGERGVRLSGGERQRIGIARALYHDPPVLVFDEATSALDNCTEDAVMVSVGGLHHRKTLIIIAHRLRTVEACDQIVVLEDGTVVAAGRYHELTTKNHVIRKFVPRTSGGAVGKAVK